MIDSFDFSGKFLQRSKKTIVLILIDIAILTLIIIISTRSSSFDGLHISSPGTVRAIGVEVYGGDINLTQDGKQYIEWGTIYPGTLTNRSFYIRSNSNTEATLDLAIANLAFQDADGKNIAEPPPIESPLNLTWNYNHTPISSSQEIYVTLTLEASSDSRFINYLFTKDVQTFIFDVVIRTSG